MYCTANFHKIVSAGLLLLLTACSGESGVSGSSGEVTAATEVEPVSEPVLPEDPDTDSQAPNTPAALRSTSVTNNSISFAWNAASDNVAVTAYELYKNGSSSAFATTNSLSYSDTGLNPQTTYSYQVRAVDAAGNISLASNTLLANTPALPDTTLPSTPAALRSTSITNNSVSLAWNAANDNVAVTAYALYKNGSSSAFATTSSLSYSDTGLNPETTYTYQVRAIDAAGNISLASNTLLANTPASPDTTLPSTPAALRSTNTTNNSVSLAWNAASDNVAVIAYVLYKNGSSEAFTGTTSLSYSDTGLDSETTYTYQVRAIDAAGNVSPLSNTLVANTLASPDTTLPSTPAALRSTNTTSDSISLAWNAASDNVAVTAYALYKNGSATPFTTTSSLSIIDNELTADQSYQYTVTAVDAAGNESGHSSVLTVSTQAASNPQPATLSWIAPTKNNDDSCLIEVEDYRLSYGTAAGSYSVVEQLTTSIDAISCTQTDYDAACNVPVKTCQYTTQPLEQGTWYFTIQALDASGIESSYSNEVNKNII